jgi:hypothetical protein
LLTNVCCGAFFGIWLSSILMTCSAHCNLLNSIKAVTLFYIVAIVIQEPLMLLAYIMTLTFHVQMFLPQPSLLHSFPLSDACLQVSKRYIFMG